MIHYSAETSKQHGIEVFYIRGTRGQREAVMDWVRETISPHHYKTRQSMMGDTLNLYLANASDAVAFKLRFADELG